MTIRDGEVPMWCRTIFGFLIVWFVPIFVAGSRETAEEEYYYILIDDFEQPVQWTGSVVAQGRTNTLIIQRIENTVEARKRIEKYATMFARDLSPASRAVSPRQNFVLGIKDIITSPGERILRIRPRQPVRIENVRSLNFYLQKDKHDFVLYPVILDVDKSRLPTRGTYCRYNGWRRMMIPLFESFYDGAAWFDGFEIRIAPWISDTVLYLYFDLLVIHSARDVQ